MPSKLELYNDALAHNGERKLASLTEAREPRRKLDDQWDRGLRYCLEQGLWNFAMRSGQFDSSPSLTPAFGYQFAFEKPSDWIRTAQVSADERFSQPLLNYSDEQGIWYADVDPIFVQVVSDDTAYGLDLSLWPETFAEYVACHLARKIVRGLTSSITDFDELLKLEKRLLNSARAKDAMNQAIGFPPRGSWSRSRSGGNAQYYNTDGRPR